jgi:hypothetical protein
MLEIYRLERAAKCFGNNDPMRECWHHVMAAQENAHDTFAGQEVSESDWHAVALDSLAALLSAEKSAEVASWFQAQGFEW